MGKMSHVVLLNIPLIYRNGKAEQDEYPLRKTSRQVQPKQAVDRNHEVSPSSHGESCWDLSTGVSEVSLLSFCCRFVCSAFTFSNYNLPICSLIDTGQLTALWQEKGQMCGLRSPNHSATLCLRMSCFIK